MTPGVVIGPALTLVSFVVWFAHAVIGVGRPVGVTTRRGGSSVELPIAFVTLATMQLLLNLSLHHFGDVLVVALSATFVALALLTRQRHPLPRAHVHCTTRRARIARLASRPRLRVSGQATSSP